VWNAFRTLSRARGISFEGPQAIPQSEIKAWLDLRDVQTKHVRADFAELIATLDDEYLEFVEEQSDEQRKEAEKRKKK
jgi:hypothetical protein